MLSLFCEFQQSPSEITDELRHQKRIRLEPLIFDILKRNYGPALDRFWNSTQIPKDVDRAVVIVERRAHENLWFLLRNVAYFARGWSIAVVCSDVNLPYLKAIAEPHVDSITWLPYFQGSPDRDSARADYNAIFKDPNFYASLPWENLFFIQTDSYFRLPIPETLLKYDFIGAPFEWDECHAGGGTTFRKRQAMIEICQRFQEDIESEDLFISKGARALGFACPPFEEGIQYIVESCIYEDPVAIHQWWTFFFPSCNDAEAILKSLLTLKI
jgi:hypothetical protein